MKVQEIMVREVCACGPHDSLADAARLMWEHDIGFVPVLDDAGRVSGVVTDRDVCMAAWTQGRPLAEIPVDSMMSRSVYSVAPETELESAEEVMRSHQVRRIPVVEEDSRLVGVISINDLAVRAADSSGKQGQALRTNVAETLGAVSRHRNATGNGHG
jgi:CBS domain-containing protein